MFRTLITVEELLSHLDEPNWVIVDCRFSMDLPDRGRRDYLKAHIPGAVYAHLNHDLSAPHIPGATSRHPLPSVDRLASTFSKWGIDQTTQVIGYDDWAGAPGAVAARLWWCLRWLGHEAVAVLDGGWEGWLQGGGRVTAALETNQHKSFQAYPRDEMLAGAEEVERIRQEPEYGVFDSRAADRFRGENETIDPVPGHIPGAFNAPYTDNAGPEGMRPIGELRQRFQSLLGKLPERNAVFYCGSGVTAAYNILAMEHAGLQGARLYPGSWSEWITDPNRPVATG